MSTDKKQHTVMLYAMREEVNSIFYFGKFNSLDEASKEIAKQEAFAQVNAGGWPEGHDAVAYSEYAGEGWMFDDEWVKTTPQYGYLVNLLAMISESVGRMLEIGDLHKDDVDQFAVRIRVRGMDIEVKVRR